MLRLSPEKKIQLFSVSFISRYREMRYAKCVTVIEYVLIIPNRINNICIILAYECTD